MEGHSNGLSHEQTDSHGERHVQKKFLSKEMKATQPINFLKTFPECSTISGAVELVLYLCAQQGFLPKEVVAGWKLFLRQVSS